MSNKGEYELRLFKERGYYRKACKVCGTPFWTLSETQTTCMDSPCVDYHFDKIAVKRPLSVDETREAFLKFFEREGHRIVKPRPVVARWRDDLYLTIASIVVFQPHVTSGKVPPPANPLVISQPCIRLEDIDSVGLTLGRHLTLFEMGGHHAFNREGDWKYWKDETVAYALEFFEKEIGLSKDLITLKESWWEGGGNAGPCFEVVSGGLELATLVFMQYKVDNGRYEPIPLKIVDTGYGIDRIAWFTQKTPTAFHAIYGSLVDDVRARAGADRPEESVMRALFTKAGRISPHDRGSIEYVLGEVSRETGFDAGLIKSIYLSESRLYSVIDHSKTLLFMLADGIVPSNQGEGYLVRLVLRRALKQLYLLGAPYDILEWLIERQADRWSNAFPHLRERVGYALEAVDMESRRFLEILKTGINKALSMITSDYISSLRRVYQEYGIPPEIVASEYEKRTGKKIEVPSDFYASIAKESSSRPPEVERTPEPVLSYPETIRVFHDSPYATETEAKVLFASENGVLLDRTVLYPTGGGQNSDTGVIVNHRGDRIRVRGAQNLEGRILHVLENPRDYLLLSAGDTVRVAVDWERRYRLMRHHTATHILLGALRKLFGPHVWQAGAEKTPEKGRLDVTHHKPIEVKDIRMIEELVNSYVDMRIPLRFHYMDRNSAEEKFGLSIYQGGAPLSSVLRIVEIPGVDAEACFGTHVMNTGEVGGVKIISVKKIQDGVYRFEYVAGTELSRHATSLERELEKISEMLGGSGEVSSRVRSLVEMMEEERALLSRYRKHVYRSLTDKLLGEAETVGGLRLVIFEDDIRDSELSTELLKEMSESHPDIMIFRLETHPEDYFVEMSFGKDAADRISAKSIAHELTVRLGGKGGGKKEHSYARFPRKLSEDELKRLIVGVIRERL